MNEPTRNPETRIALFQRRGIRRAIHNKEWWFVVSDVVAALTDSANATDYLNKMRRRDPELAKGYGQFVHPLPIPTAGGVQNLNCANTEGLFRIIQSIARTKDAQGFPQNKQTAREGGSVAGHARRELERKRGRKVSTRENYLALAQSAKQAKQIHNS